MSKSQHDMLLDHFRAGGTLTVAEALGRYGIYALSQRCGELIRDGHKVISETVTLDNGKHVARYRMGKAERPPIRQVSDLDRDCCECGSAYRRGPNCATCGAELPPERAPDVARKGMA